MLLGVLLKGSVDQYLERKRNRQLLRAIAWLLRADLVEMNTHVEVALESDEWQFGPAEMTSPSATWLQYRELLALELPSQDWITVARAFHTYLGLGHDPPGTLGPDGQAVLKRQLAHQLNADDTLARLAGTRPVSALPSPSRKRVEAKPELVGSRIASV